MGKTGKEYSELSEHYIDFTRNRITKLLTQQGLSEHKLSVELGHSGSYVNSITSGRSLPAFDEFLYMCEILHVTPNEFFNEENNEPVLIRELLDLAKKLNPEQLELLKKLAKEMK